MTWIWGMGRHAAGAGWLRNACTDDMSSHPSLVRNNVDPFLLQIAAGKLGALSKLRLTFFVAAKSLS